ADLIPKEGFVGLVGAPAGGKSFIALDWAMSISEGIPWGVYNVTQAPVVYVAAEGGVGVYKRLAALRKHYPDCGDVPFYILKFPVDLLHGLLHVEHEMGRDRDTAPPKGPRIIDLDLLLYADLILADPELTLPHPEMHKRRFVLEPLAEIAPGLQHPTLHRSIEQLLASLSTA
ncbi:MAG: 2-amino-4-hydroxy-6-hydroxymethyldihydropteridine diphosphokinase, partial [Acidobacteriota bacterium]